MEYHAHAFGNARRIFFFLSLAEPKNTTNMTEKRTQYLGFFSMSASSFSENYFDCFHIELCAQSLDVCLFVVIVQLLMLAPYTSTHSIAVVTLLALKCEPKKKIHKQCAAMKNMNINVETTYRSNSFRRHTKKNNDFDNSLLFRRYFYVLCAHQFNLISSNHF